MHILPVLAGLEVLVLGGGAPQYDLPTEETPINESDEPDPIDE